MSDGIDVFHIILGVGIIFLAILGFWSQSHVSDLGQAICEERYDMDFLSYTGGELSCKPKPEPYDGINIRKTKEVQR